MRVVAVARRFGIRRLPFAALWYGARALRQLTLRGYFHTIGRYGFSTIGRHVRIDGMPEFLFPCADIRLGNNVRIGKRCVFQGSHSSLIALHDDVTINDGCYLTALYSITIGRGTSVGEYTSIRDYNHSFRDATRLLKEQGYEGAAITIGEDCWIGRGCMILPGVTIGDGAIVGANSVVTKSVERGSIVVGAPARVVGARY
jgi:acetyltransferase-like isoleucine patch superfamily enzyme